MRDLTLFCSPANSPYAEIDSSFLPARFQLSLLLSKLNRLESLKNLESLLTVEPRHVPSLLEFGRLLQTCGESLKRLRPFRRREEWQKLFFLEAQAVYKRAISMQPDSPVALLEYCISCTQSTASEAEVRRIVQRVAEHKPTDAAILCNLGCLLQKLGENKKAEEALLQAIARAPNHLPSIYNLARLHHYFLSNSQLALRFYDKVHVRRFLVVPEGLTGSEPRRGRRRGECEHHEDDQRSEEIHSCHSEFEVY